jgi:NAD(P) transhydrogenase subunit alpha
VAGVRVFVPRERAPAETRVAATPETVKQMLAAGLEVTVEEGAGERACFLDAAYERAGAKLVAGSPEAWRAADLVVKVCGPVASDALGGVDEAEVLREGAVLVGFLAPHRSQALAERLSARRLTALAMELVPRITRAQRMDALSSQASIAGYKAVLVAASHLPKYFPLLMTAAGTVKPARVVVMGAGVAGLQAIATAKRLGAVVEASDVREAVKEQVESLGAKFIPLPKMEERGEGKGGYAREMSAAFLAEQRRIVGSHLVEADVVITTALVPGKRAPVLVPAEVVRAMRPGAVIVDLAVEQGGNCELSVAGRDVREGGVLIVGHPNLPATVPYDASLLYARNVWALCATLLRDKKLVVDLEDEITRGALFTHDGVVRYEMAAAAPPPREAAAG